MAFDAAGDLFVAQTNGFVAHYDVDGVTGATNFLNNYDTGGAAILDLTFTSSNSGA